MNINLTFPEISMICAVYSLGQTDNINIFFTLMVVSVITAFFKVCLVEKRIEDIKIITENKINNE